MLPLIVPQAGLGLGFKWVLGPTVKEAGELTQEGQREAHLGWHITHS